MLTRKDAYCHFAFAFALAITCWSVGTSFVMHPVYSTRSCLRTFVQPFLSKSLINNIKYSDQHERSQRREQRSSSSHYMVWSLDDAGGREELNQRIEEVRRDIIKEQDDKPPNPNLGAQEFIESVMKALKNVDDPLPDFGCIVLLRSSTPRWKREILRSIGAPTWADEQHVAAALNLALGRKKNQFGILVGGAEGEEGEEYVLQFPSESVEDLDEGTCWVECRLRDPKDGKLLAVIGWDLKKRKQDSAWLVDRLDWQDFRDEYRPGYGREEWIRVFG